MPPDLVKLSVTDVRTAVPAGAGVEAGLVILRESEAPHRFLRIIVGQPEARAIHASWTGNVASRPGTWDLFVSTIAMLDGRLERAVITAVEDGRHFFAIVELDKAGHPLVLACRPSDAIALALRAWGSEIFAERTVLDNAGVLEDGNPAPPESVDLPERTDPPPPVVGAPTSAVTEEPAVNHDT